MREIILSELHALSHAGVLGDIEKPKHDMVFLPIVPDKTTKGEKVFSLVAVWAHPHQAHQPSLGEVAHKLTLLINTGTNWVYVFAQLNDSMLYTSLSSEGHVSVMIDGTPSMSACGCLSQLEVCRLLQCGDQLVYPEGINGGL